MGMAQGSFIYPVEAVVAELLDALDTGNEVILEAPPGAGKTTLVPLRLLGQPWLGEQRIVMLEPRRIAARAAAERMAQLLGEKVGRRVGYRMRGETRVSAETRIEVVTDGVLTRMLQEDPSLAGIGLLIFDEVHERNLDSDLGLALVLQGRELFRDVSNPLKLLLMSATLDSNALSTLLDGAQVLRCEGRQYPVTLHYSSPYQLGQSITAPLTELISTALVDNDGGSLLVFLPGQAEIRAVSAALKKLPLVADILIAPIYGGLSLKEQRQAILPAPSGRRKIVLATNIAETSLTIDGVDTVVDAGLVREPQYHSGTGMTRLKTQRISRASSVQRAGRAGRLRAGQCYRMWSQEQQTQLVAQAVPEVLQADLAPLTLQLLAWGVDQPADLRWQDEPPAAAWQAGLSLLASFQAVEQGAGDSLQLTEHGSRMAGLPVHPRLAHMLLKARDWNLLPPACRLAALMSERYPLASSGCDVNARLRVVAGDSSCPPSLREWLARLRRQVERYHQQCLAVTGASQQRELIIDDADVTGLLLGCAWPERLARRVSMGKYRLANGRQVDLPVEESLAGSTWLAISETGGRSGQASDRVYSAAVFNPQLLDGVLSSLVRERTVVEWDRRTERLVSEKQRRVGALVVSTEPLENCPQEARDGALLGVIRSRGLALLPWTEELHQWQSRVLLLRSVELETLEDSQWPDVSERTLLASLETWLSPFLGGVSSLQHLQRIDLAAALKSLIPWPLPRLLDKLAPLGYLVPSGSLVAINYREQPPVLAVKLQEMFGSECTPVIAGGSIALVVHLLSPARRPLQVTQDLAGFWRTGYAAVRKEMKGRYPKHPWPEDPLHAEPTAGTRRR
jgi:ATP-dependent helicase HrpB